MNRICLGPTIIYWEGPQNYRQVGNIWMASAGASKQSKYVTDPFTLEESKMAKVELKFWDVSGVNGVGEVITRRIFAESQSAAAHRFYAQTGILADSVVESPKAWA